LLKGVAVGVGASGIAFFLVGGNADERLHRVIWALLLLVVMCTAAAGWAWRRLGNRRAAARLPARPPSRVTNWVTIARPRTDFYGRQRTRRRPHLARSALPAWHRAATSRERLR
jgi:hypothetical protein